MGAGREHAMSKKKKKEKAIEEQKEKGAKKALKTAASETVARLKAKSSAPRKKKTPASTIEAAAPVISNEDITLRAYFISEHRRIHGHPGDETGDWVEAERQLREEALKKSKKK